MEIDTSKIKVIKDGKDISDKFEFEIKGDVLCCKNTTTEDIELY